MNATGKRRLLKLADFLEKLPPRKFAMRTWATAAKEGRPSCGTAACALGWATAIPAFYKAGLYLHPTPERLFHQYEPRIGRRRQISAGAFFFKLSRKQALELFAPADTERLSGKHGQKVVIKRIRALVASGPA